MAKTWTKITVIGKTKNLDEITAVMSMLDNGLMIEDYSDFSLNGMYGELVDDEILNADKATVKVSLFVPEERNFIEYKTFKKNTNLIINHLLNFTNNKTVIISGICNKIEEFSAKLEHLNKGKVYYMNDSISYYINKVKNTLS